jgi:hypothetical protein
MEEAIVDQTDIDLILTGAGIFLCRNTSRHKCEGECGDSRTISYVNRAN